MSVVAFDPSIATTGAACVSDSGLEIREALLIHVKAEGREVQERLRELRADVRSFLETHKPKAIAIETPAENRLPPDKQGFGRRSAVTLPTYGMAVGAVLTEAEHWAELQHNREIVVLCRASDAWSRGYPGTKGDPYKTARVRFCESMFKLAPGALGAESKAGNLADAILLAHHAAHLCTSNLTIKGASKP